MLIIFSICNEDDETTPCSNELSIQFDSNSIQNVSLTGHTSLELVADSNRDCNKNGDQSNKKNFAASSNQKHYYLNNLEWYRIGACSYYNVYLPKESISKESGKYSLTLRYQNVVRFISYFIDETIFQMSTSLLFSKFCY